MGVVPTLYFARAHGHGLLTDLLPPHTAREKFCPLALGGSVPLVTATGWRLDAPNWQVRAGWRA